MAPRARRWSRQRGPPAQSETAPAAGPIRRRLPGTPRCPPLSTSFQEPPPLPPPPRRPGRAPRPNPRTNCNPIKADIILLVFTAHQGGDNNRRCRRAAARQPPAPAGSGWPRGCAAPSRHTAPAPALLPLRPRPGAQQRQGAPRRLRPPKPPCSEPRFRRCAPRFSPARPQPSTCRRQSRAGSSPRTPDPVTPRRCWLAVPSSAVCRALSSAGSCRGEHAPRTPSHPDTWAPNSEPGLGDLPPPPHGPAHNGLLVRPERVSSSRHRDLAGAARGHAPPAPAERPGGGMSPVCVSPHPKTTGRGDSEVGTKGGRAPGAVPSSRGRAEPPNPSRPPTPRPPRPL